MDGDNAYTFAFTDFVKTFSPETTALTTIFAKPGTSLLFSVTDILLDAPGSRLS
jgi:hypothetical protein